LVESTPGACGRPLIRRSHSAHIGRSPRGSRRRQVR
jgi:hypothetical protein